MVSRSSSSRSTRVAGATWIATLVAVVIATAASAVSGCTPVRPDEKEYLAQPAMTFGAEGPSGGQEEHVLANREGSIGGGGAAGGGCGCN